ncbi:MAG: PHP domain-containing protein [Spirochaetes bacterium]|nr:PHP domain-containing protein [Spirochaetota bacterium]
MKPHDLHTHTTYSDGKNPVVDHIRGAEAAGLSYLAITDHCFNPSAAEWITQMRDDIRAVKTHVTVFAGIEAQIRDASGATTVPQQETEKLDIILVDIGGMTEGVFRNPPASKQMAIKNAVTAYVNVSADPLVDIVAHPFNLGRTPSGIASTDITDADVRTVARAFAANGMIFEIMNSSWWWFPDEDIASFTKRYADIVRIAAEENVRLSKGSDAHAVCGVGMLSWVDRVIAMAGVEKAIIDPSMFVRNA